MYEGQFIKKCLSQSGFTLLELLISMSIGIIIVFSASGLMLTTAESRKAVKHSAELQEEAFFVTHLIKQQLAQAGFRSMNSSPSYRSIPVPNLYDHFPAVSGSWNDGQLIRIAGNSLFYRYDGASLPDGTPDGSIYDCLGNAIPAGTIIESSISLQGNSLVCTVGTNTALLIDGSLDTRVEQMNIALGVDSNNDGQIDQSIDSSVATTADFEDTRSVTIRLLLSSKDNVIKHNQTYYFNGTTTATDNRLRVEAVVTAALRH